jgi:hypothetical protein
LLISSRASFASLFLGARLLLEFPLSDIDTLKVFSVEGVGIVANGLGAAFLIAGFRRGHGASQGTPVGTAHH